ncbi:hypothetical protein ACVWYH_006549 [Bradyrhizobium sp. GM24.11]
MSPSETASSNSAAFDQAFLVCLSNAFARWNSTHWKPLMINPFKAAQSFGQSWELARNLPLLNGGRYRDTQFIVSHGCHRSAAPMIASSITAFLKVAIKPSK